MKPVKKKLKPVLNRMNLKLTDALSQGLTETRRKLSMSNGIDLHEQDLTRMAISIFLRTIDTIPPTGLLMTPGDLEIYLMGAIEKGVKP
jgi:hypothetical protein